MEIRLCRVNSFFFFPPTEAFHLTSRWRSAVTPPPLAIVPHDFSQSRPYRCCELLFFLSLILQPNKRRRRVLLLPRPPPPDLALVHTPPLSQAVQFRSRKSEADGLLHEVVSLCFFGGKRKRRNIGGKKINKIKNRMSLFPAVCSRAPWRAPVVEI